MSAPELEDTAIADTWPTGTTEILPAPDIDATRARLFIPNRSRAIDPHEAEFLAKFNGRAGALFSERYRITGKDDYYQEALAHYCWGLDAASNNPLLTAGLYVDLANLRGYKTQIDKALVPELEQDLDLATGSLKQVRKKKYREAKQQMLDRIWDLKMAYGVGREAASARLDASEARLAILGEEIRKAGKLASEETLEIVQVPKPLEEITQEMYGWPPEVEGLGTA